MTRLRPPDQRQSDAVEARIELDLRVGAAFTRFQTMALQQRFGQLADHTLSYGTSASACHVPGRGERNANVVGLCARAMPVPDTGVCRRALLSRAKLCARAVLAHPADRYQGTGGAVAGAAAWASPAVCPRQDGVAGTFHWRRDRLFDEQLATVLYEKCTEAGQGTVTSVQCKPTSRWCVWPRLCCDGRLR
jgi:DNA topoisomerase III